MFLFSLYIYTFFGGRGGGGRRKGAQNRIKLIWHLSPSDLTLPLQAYLFCCWVKTCHFVKECHLVITCYQFPGDPKFLFRWELNFCMLSVCRVVFPWLFSGCATIFFTPSGGYWLTDRVYVYLTGSMCRRQLLLYYADHALWLALSISLVDIFICITCWICISLSCTRVKCTLD